MNESAVGASVGSRAGRGDALCDGERPPAGPNYQGRVTAAHTSQSAERAPDALSAPSWATQCHSLSRVPGRGANTARRPARHRAVETQDAKAVHASRSAL